MVDQPEDYAYSGHRVYLGMESTAIVDADPVLRHFAESIVSAPNLSAIVYLSTIGVYGDHKGDWVDETTLPQPASDRSRAPG